MSQPKKSLAREVAGGTLIFLFTLIAYTFFVADAEKVTALSGIVMGFCSPVALGCLGMFGYRSHQNVAKTVSS